MKTIFSTPKIPQGLKISTEMAAKPLKIASSFVAGIKQLKSDVFIKSSAPVKENTFAQPVFKKGKFNISDFLSLSEKQIQEIKHATNAEQMFAASLTTKYAAGLKEALDKEYGEGKYVFISIGTSPSMMAKVFECMGVKTRYLPISELRYAEDFYTNMKMEDLIAHLKFDKYGEFLKSQGISAESLSKGDEKYIFYDYTKTGNTLDRFKAIMREKFNLPEDKIQFRSLNEDLEDLFLGQTYIDDKDAITEYIRNYLLKANAETYSSVGSLPISKVDSTDYSLERLGKYNEDDPKFFNFLVMDILNKQGSLKENPANRNII